MRKEVLELLEETTLNVALNQVVRGVRRPEISGTSGSMTVVTMENGHQIQAFGDDPMADELAKLKKGDVLSFVFRTIDHVSRTADETPSGRAFEARIYQDVQFIDGKEGKLSSEDALPFLGGRSAMAVQPKREYSNNLSRQTGADSEPEATGDESASSAFKDDEPEA